MQPPAITRPELLTTIPREIAAVNDYQPYALQRLNQNASEYLMQGGADEITLRENCLAFQRIQLKGHVLQAVSDGHTRLQLFGPNLFPPHIFGATVVSTLVSSRGRTCHRNGR